MASLVAIHMEVEQMVDGIYWIEEKFKRTYFHLLGQECQVSGDVAHGGQRQGSDGQGVGEGGGDEMRSRLNWAVWSI